MYFIYYSVKICSSNVFTFLLMNFPTVPTMPSCGGIMLNIEKSAVLGMEDQTANVCTGSRYMYAHYKDVLINLQDFMIIMKMNLTF